MARGYGYDLRIRVIKSVDAGQSNVGICKLYQIGRATVYRWINQRKREGNIYPKTHWQKGYGHKIHDLKAFKKFVEESPGRTLVEMAEAWGGVKRMTIYRSLKKLGFTHKKNQLWLQGA